ncbi:MAG: M20 family metallopeptidase [Crocinitomicaceae bacterium]|nr:M20 family metallopeptidase [Crocinitomicaceae bacterium]
MNPEIKNSIKEMSSLLFSKVKGYREHIHAHPELSYEEHETMHYVSEQLNAIGIEHTCGIGETGIIATIRGDHHTADQEAIGLRADLDALPIHEENEVAYKSTVDGVMHACGHDVHTSVLLGAAEILNTLRNELPSPVKLLFQPGEEKNPGGATYMIRDGALKNPRVKEMYALHVFPDMVTGKVGFKEGIYMASCDEIYITIHGKGGHGATPHECIDPIYIGANMITSMQQIVSRQCDPTVPCVLSFGHFEALGATNVIPSTAYLKGTFRTMNEPWRAEALELIEKSANDIAKANGGTVTVEISKGYPYLENDPATTAKMRATAIETLGADKVEELPIRLTAEDFSYYSQEIPVCFFRLGVRNEERGITYGVHHPKFDIDENALITGVQMMASAPFSSE